MSDNQKFLLLISALILVLFVAWLSDSGYVLNTGFGEYTTSSTSKSVVTDPNTSQNTVTETTTTEVHPGKTLWDWMGLIIIPLALGLGIWWLNKQQRENEQRLTLLRQEEERKLADDRQQEAILQTYLDKISELLLKEDLLRRQSDTGEPVRNVAQTRTTTVLRVFEAKRRNIVTRFLVDSHLEDGLLIHASLNNADLREIWFYGFNLNEANFSKVNLFKAYLYLADLGGANLEKANLSGANLGEANLGRANLIGADLIGADLIGAFLIEANLYDADLSGANLIGADLSGANLGRANLSGADLFGAFLSGTNLIGANLIGADLSGADLSGANLRGANADNEQLSQANSLKGAIMPDGTKHE